MSLAIGCHVRRRPAHLDCDFGDVMRVREDGAQLLILIAGSIGGPYAWPNVSSLLLDRYEQAWSPPGAPARRMRHAFDVAGEGFQVAARREQPLDPMEVGEVSGTLLAATVVGRTLHAQWIGGETCLVVRGFEIVAQARPHLLYPQHYALATRTVGDHAPPDALEVGDLRDGDWIIATSADVIRALGADDIALRAGRHTSPQALAAELVTAAGEADAIDFALGAACAIRIG